MGCRGICERLAMRRTATGGAYDERCRCNACGVWMSASVSTGRCPCCRQRLRFAKRGIAGRLRRAAGAFYDAPGTQAEMSNRSDGVVPEQPAPDDAPADGGLQPVPAGTVS